MAIAAIFVSVPWFFPSAYYYRIGALVFIFGLAVAGLNLLMGIAGQVSLGHAGFLGIGAYSVAIGPTHLGMPSWLCLFAGAGLSAAVAFFVGRPILRLKGHYLAVATLGFGLLVAIVLTNEAGLTGGPDGMTVPKLTLFGWSVRGSDAWYWIAGTTFIGGFVLALNLMGSPTGRALQAIHDSEIAALMLGGKTVGLHSVGPNWQHFDGSAVRAKMVSSAPGATSNDVSWLQLETTEQRGNGTLSHVTTVQRINTKGGATQGPCETVGTYRNAPYSADYVFLLEKNERRPINASELPTLPPNARYIQYAGARGAAAPAGRDGTLPAHCRSARGRGDRP